ncbi:hypothetical protein FOCC_FOCC007571, partial [Frankliniella occidentalis]
MQITELSVPDHADVGDTAELVCHHDLGDATLNSLAPKSASDTKVTLTQLTFNSSGTYRCEVSADAPKFETVHRESNMTVMVVVAWSGGLMI